MMFRCHGETDRGLVRSRNEDFLECAVADSRDSCCGVVADGVGGQPAGDVASETACAAAMKVLGAALAYPDDDQANTVEAVIAANRAVLDAQSERPAVAGMATTVVTATMRARGYAVAHTGDSRAYLYRGGRLQCLTRDHTAAQQMVDEGRLSAADAETSPYGHLLTSAAGLSDNPEIDSGYGPVEPGDALLLCTDGLCKYVDQDRMEAILAESRSPEEATRALIEAANAAGGADNTTVLILEALAD